MEKQLYSCAIIGSVSSWQLQNYGNKCIGFRPYSHVSFNLYKHRCSLFRKQIPHEIRIPIYAMVQTIDESYAYTLCQALGIFIPLIVINLFA